MTLNPFEAFGDYLRWNRGEKPDLVWRGDEWVPGIWLLAKCKVVYRGPFGTSINPFNIFMSPCGIWMVKNGNEALFLEAPFVWEERTAVLNRIGGYLNDRGIRLKYITVSHLHRDHAEGLTALLERFPGSTFVYPESWKRDWKRGEGLPIPANKNIDPPGFGNKFIREHHVSYREQWTGDLDGEPIFFYRAPYHSITDQIVSFRGTAILPDWHLPQRLDENLKLVEAPAHEIVNTIKLLRKGAIHSHIPVHANGPLRKDFQQRLEIASKIFPG